MNNLIATFRQLLPLLPRGARRFIVTYIVATSALALLDTAALVLLAVVLAPLSTGGAMRLPGIGAVQDGGFIVVLGLICLLITAKGVAAVFLQRLATRRFAGYELAVGDQLFAAYINAPWVERLKRSTPQLVRLADVGIANVTGGFLLPIIALPSQAVTFVAVFVVLVVASPLTALVTLVYLGIVGAVLYVIVSRRAIRAGRINRDSSFRVANLMTEMMGALKEITLRDKATEVAAVVHDRRVASTRARASIAFLGAVPRYILESALVLGFALVGGISYAIGGTAAAFSAIALFGLAGFRMIPSITSFQSIITQVSANAPHVQAVIGDIAAAEGYVLDAEVLGRKPLSQRARLLEFRDVSFRYPGSAVNAVDSVDLVVPMGRSLAFVGSSGSGKTTLVDLILGLISPSSGAIALDGEPLADVLAAWRTRVGYVPQDVALFDASIAQNVALTWEDDFDPEKVRDALRRAQLLDLVESRPGGIDAPVGDRGLALSGGQRQRLGIARALYIDPLVLVLDEATSALDSTTESQVAAAIQELRGDVTVIAVAHRLSTIRDSEQICFMKDGRLTARGTFDELVETVPEFAAQAALAGLAVVETSRAVDDVAGA